MLALNGLTQRSQNLLARFFGSVNDRKIKAKTHLVAQINQLEP
jgi:preprotein translocase subunit SecA